MHGAAGIYSYMVAESRAGLLGARVERLLYEVWESTR